MAKTKLVGVGVNGQENIEIGDNLTLANGKLSSATGGGLPSTITFDEDENRKVGKNLGVDGKLTLKSLVSNDNKDGDITKVVKKIYCHTLTATDDSMGTVVFTVYCTINYQIDFSKVSSFVLGKGGGVSASGIINIDGSNKMITSVYVNSYSRVVATWIDISDRTTGEYPIDGFTKVKDKVSVVR